MPFDNPNTRVEIATNEEELAIIDRMSVLLDAPKKWCKYDFGGFSPTEKCHSYCLIGAVRVAGGVGPHQMLSSGAGLNVICALQDVVGMPIENFNDDDATTFDVMRRALTRTRASFE